MRTLEIKFLERIKFQENLIRARARARDDDLNRVGLRWHAYACHRTPRAWHVISMSIKRALPVGTTRNTELHCFRSFLRLLRHADDIVSSAVLRKHLARVPREATWAITRFAERKKLRAWLLTYCVTGISRMPEYTWVYYSYCCFLSGHVFFGACNRSSVVTDVKATLKL